MPKQSDKKKRKEGQFEDMKRRPALDQRKKELMMAVLLRNEDAFKATREILKPEHFGEFDRGYKVAWALANEFYDEHEALPGFEFLMAEIEGASEANPNLFNDAEYDKLSSFIEYAFDKDSFEADITQDRASADWGIKTAKKFLDERLAAKMKEVIQSKDMLPANLPEFMNQMAAEAEQIASVSTEVDFDPFPDDWHKTASIKVFSTGIPFFDEFLGGGHAPGEVYGLMGPYGSCKTTIASMLIVEAAKAFYQEHLLDPSQPPKLAVIACYEARKPEMRNRTLGYAAMIRRATMEAMAPDKPLELAGFSTSDKLKKYEKRIWRAKINNGEKVAGELERVMDALTYLRRHMVVLDMTGHETKGVGNGGIKEVSQMISNVCRQRKAKCGLFVMDYVGAMVKRYMGGNDVETSELRHLIGGAPLTIKSQIGDVFDCPSYALHQLAGEANSFGSAVLADHTNAAESKSFAENLDFSFSISKPQDPDAVALFGCTKHRRQPGRMNTIIKIDGGLNRVLSADDKYMINTHARKIMLIADVNKLPENSAIKKNSAAAGGGSASSLD